MLKPEIKKTNLKIARPGTMLAVALVCLLACANANLLGGVLAQETQSASEKSAVTFAVTASFADKNQVAPDEQIELRLNRAPGKAEGRIGVVINQTDISNLFTSIETTLRYNPQLLPLPLGESEMTIYLVSPKDQWKEIARFRLNVSNEKPAEPEKPKAEDNKQAEDQSNKPAEQSEAKPEQKTEAKPTEDAKPQAEVKKQDEPANQQPSAEQKTDEQKTEDQKTGEQKTDAPQASEGAQVSEAAQQEKPAQKRFGFEKLDFVPSIAINIKSQPAQSNFPEANRPERPTFTDLNMQASIKSDVARGPFNSQTQFDFVGASFQKEALRFGELGDRALQVDLSSYLMQFQSGKMKYQSGHYSYGTLRHLMSGFSSRGMMMSFPVGKGGDFSLTAMNGSTVVGFGNFFGLDQRKHQLLSGTLGYELLPKRPGGLRVEAGLLDGWLLPVTGFTEGAINDAQRSQGLGFRLLASDPKQRYKLEGGFTRSKFLNPADPLLNQNANVREVPPITRNARYLDASAEFFKDIPVTKEKKFNLTFTFKHELVDPLFRSLGASTQADKAANDFSLVSTIGDVTAQFTHTRFNDNLANIASILTSLNRANTLLIGVPTAALFSDPQKPSPLFPRVSYNFSQIHAFSAAVPVNGGFEQDPTSIPDQLSTNQGLTADWQIQKWRLGYRLNHSFINNQQPGSELADQLTLASGVVVGVSPNGSLDLNLDVSFESVNNKAVRTVDRKVALTPTINWKMSKRATFASNFSTTLAADRAKTKRDRNITFDMQWTYQFAFFENDKFRKLTGQFFIRYADNFVRNRNFVLITDDLQKTHTLSLGLSFNIF